MPTATHQLRHASPLERASVATTASTNDRSTSAANHQQRSSHRLAAPTLTRSVSADGYALQQQQPPRLRVLADQHALWQRARATRAAIDFRALTDLSVTQWKWKASNNRFTLFQRQSGGSVASTNESSTVHEVLSAGEVRCSAAELANILRPTSETEHNVTMQALYKKAFIYGSSVAVLPTDPINDDEHVAVKTSTFVRSRLFAKHEQWCYLEHFAPIRASDPSCGFTVSIGSMDETELLTGKADRDRVNDVHNVVAGYLVEQVPNESVMRVLFYGQFTDVSSTTNEHRGTSTTKTTKPLNTSSTSAMKTRLTFLAKGASQLPDIVRRRRLGAQTFVDRMAFAASNAHCICCTKRLHVFAKKKRCYLCGYFVCDKDWSIQSVETRQGQLSTVRVCARCLEGVEHCDFANVTPLDLGAPRIRPDGPTARSPSATIASFLQDALRSAGSDAKKRSVQSVIKHLVGHEQAKASAGSSSFTHASLLTDASHEHEYHAALDAYLTVDDVLPIEQCVLANAATRAYSIDVPADMASGTAPAFPVALNEATRLATIDREHMREIGNAEEFNIIASLAARELDCHASLVTVIAEDQQLVLGANLVDLQTMAMPRAHAFCSHTILDDKPLVLPHPEADVRFANFIPVKHLGAKFYCGFPIVGTDNTVVGSVCCLDMKSHELTQSQYAAMTKLAATASKVMQLKGQEIESRARVATGTTTLDTIFKLFFSLYQQFGPRLFTSVAGWGSKVFTLRDYYFWIPIVGPFIGGALGGLIYMGFVEMHHPHL